MSKFNVSEVLEKAEKEYGLGKGILVDKKDYELFKNIKFHIGAKNYVLSNTGQYLHRMIMKTPKNMDTDHINGNKLDNRRCNLRICTRSQNNINKEKYKIGNKNCSSKFKGVGWDKNRNKWISFTTFKNKFISFGRFNSEKEAAEKYNKEVIKYYKKFAKLNII